MVPNAIITRLLSKPLKHHLKRGKSILLLGPRQVGKTTLLRNIKSDLLITLLRPTIRISYEKDPEKLLREIKGLGIKKPLVIVDEIQKVPALLDIIQEIIDEKEAQFVLTGSSARKLKRQKSVNLLPGRVVSLRLDSLILEEMKKPDLNTLLFYGSLPEVFLTQSNNDKEIDLKTYVETYLEEEVRIESLVRELAPFARFIELAGIESGKTINYLSISQEIGVDAKTITNYFEILFDCLIAERVDPLTHSLTRKKLIKSSRYLFFDLGVRRLAAEEGTRVTPERTGELFEQFVGIELIRLLRLHKSSGKLKFWRDPDGVEIDWVIDYKKIYVPIEVKYSNKPSRKHIKNLKTFMAEYENAGEGFIVCRCERKQKLADNITAIPWDKLHLILDVLKDE